MSEAKAWEYEAAAEEHRSRARRAKSTNERLYHARLAKRYEKLAADQPKDGI